MDKLEFSVRLAVTAEYERAAEKFGKKHNSAHEAFAVILEEYEEAIEDTQRFRNVLHTFWGVIKGDIQNLEYKQQILDEMYTMARMAACEWVQVAAMCHKALQGYER